MRRNLIALLVCAPLAASCRASDSAAPDDTTTPVVTNGIPALIAIRANSDATASVVSVNTDGSNVRMLASPETVAGTAQATYAGSFIVFSDASNANAQQLVVVDQSGKKRTLVAPSSQILSAFAPSISPDSQYVYFRAVPASQPGSTAIWRVRLDGSGLASIGAARPNAIGPATISPDGRTLLETTSDSVIFTTVATGATHGERVRCPGAQYSPDGLHVSCVSQGDLMVYDAQFVNTPRTLGDGTYSESAGTDWTPDGTKILATSTTKGPELVKYADGSILSASLNSSYKSAQFVH